MSKTSCEKRDNTSDYACIDGCEYCWKTRYPNGSSQFGCLGCQQGYNGTDWLEGEVVGSCTKNEADYRCSPFCKYCTMNS